MNEPKWLVWARRVQAIAQSGLTYTDNSYERERYEALRALAAEMMAEGSGADARMIENLFAEQKGYATPKVDVRGAVFDPEGRVLLVRERIDKGRWTLPGGWADVNQSPSACVVREVWEEAGLRVRAVELIAVHDRALRRHEPPFPFHIYKLFFRCEAIGPLSDARGDGHETDEARFFAEEELPLDELSRGRVLPEQLKMVFEHARVPGRAAEFD